MWPHRHKDHRGQRQLHQGKAVEEAAQEKKEYLETLASVVDKAARAYHAERLAFRILKQTARPRAQSFLRAYAPEITEDAGRIVDEAVQAAEIKLLGWSEDEAKQ